MLWQEEEEMEVEEEEEQTEMAEVAGEVVQDTAEAVDVVVVVEEEDNFKLIGV